MGVGMPVNLDKPHLWKADMQRSVDMYNEWFMQFAPKAFRETRIGTTKRVEAALHATGNFANIQPLNLRRHPEILPTLRMSTCPPLAVDRLIGLSGASSNLINCMEDGKLPVRMAAADMEVELAKVLRIIEKMLDPDIFVWRGRGLQATEVEVHRAATIVADRLCGAVANPIVRNTQEQRQLACIKQWLEGRGYMQLPRGSKMTFDKMPPSTFAFRMNVAVQLENEQFINVPIDAAIMPHQGSARKLPVFFEAKSAGDFKNTNKRRKEEAVKMAQLRSTYGDRIGLNLFLCGYFDSGYLGYEASEGIDWVWEHRIEDMEQFGI